MWRATGGGGWRGAMTKAWALGLPAFAAGVAAPSGPSAAPAARRAAAALVGIGERPAPVEPCPHDRQRQILLDPGVGADLAHRHHLDEGEIEALGAAPGDEIVELVVVDALEGDRVD